MLQVSPPKYKPEPKPELLQWSHWFGIDEGQFHLSVSEDLLLLGVSTYARIRDGARARER